MSEGASEAVTPEPGAHPWRRPMTPRDPDEAHRPATSLEHFFDL